METAAIGSLFFVLIGLVVLFLVVLLLRELACWYFKINQIVDLLEKILEAVKKPGQEVPEKKAL